MNNILLAFRIVLTFVYIFSVPIAALHATLGLSTMALATLFVMIASPYSLMQRRVAIK